MRGQLSTCQFENRTIQIYTPPSYLDDESARFPAVIVQDGRYLFEGSIEALEADFARGVTQEVVFVGIEPIRRDVEYTPWEAEPLQEGECLGGEGDKYLSFVTEQVMPYVRERYRVTEDPSQIGIAGGSFGGLISFYAAFRKPDHFGRFILMSASLWYPNMLTFVENNAFAKNDIRLYMYVGEREGVGRANLLGDMVPHTRKVYEMLKPKMPGGSGQVLLEMDPEGVHTHSYFNRYFPHGMRFVYPGPNAD
ncbi:alpha/beta hydrolase [Paenibacillus methanolicus]|uniref:Putative alpha/beta superfamily hydrolase n=1 Tax=Paenibacillus methanolicus TaxID=582686 RepID=A0A5S5BUA3_9BACL|nr:alpha/beta hydrolase-fold protein [Paenibacillus methanolicus]TYP69173.1 putative alpha/beta superfamily hydrolase [Paenibacillus methanolicus]